MIQNTETYNLLTDFIRCGQDDFYRLAYGYVKNRESALDIVQEAIVKAFNNIGSLRNSENIKAWFYRILVNESINCYRKNKKVCFLENIENLQITENEPDRAEILDLYHSIDRLEPKTKTVIILRFFEDMSLQEISEVTGDNLNTVKTRLYRALEKLRSFISEV